MNSDKSEDHGDIRRGIQSIEIGARIIEALTVAEGPMTLKAISSATGIGSSSCHRYLTSLVRVGLLSQDTERSRYDLGARLMHAGLRAVSRINVTSIGLKACEKLLAVTGHTVVLALWSDQGPVIVDWRLGPKIVRANINTGSIVPVMASATGRVLMAYLPEELTAPLVAAEGFSAKEANAIAADIRRAGYALLDGVTVAGLSAASAPIRNSRGDAVLALSLIDLPGGFSDEAIAALIRLAREASAELGWYDD